MREAFTVQSRTRRPAKGLLWLSTLLLIPSCVTPVVSRPHCHAIGFFAVQSWKPHPAVEYSQAQGLGLAVVDRRLSLGYVHWCHVEAEVDGRSYIAETPLADIAVGDAAEKAGLEFIQGEAGRFDRR